MFSGTQAASEAIERLAHVGEPALAQGHNRFWCAFRERLCEATPALREPTGVETSELAGTGVNRILESDGGVRVGARLILPDGACRGGVLVLHGYGSGEALDDNTPWRARGLATLKLRVRGFPGSTLDAGDLTSNGTGWITSGLEDAESGALRGAVADVAHAVIALRAALGGAPVSVRGESFGGGLAVIAAAHLPHTSAAHRLAIGLPSLGDWEFRRARGEGEGAGREALDLIEREPGKADRVRRTLRLFDAAAHARRVLCPVLCKLATTDPVVPPSSAAAIFNGLGSDPGLKRRFLVAVGHGDGGPEDLRRHASFDRAATRFLDPQEDALAALLAVGGAGD